MLKLLGGGGKDSNDSTECGSNATSTTGEPWGQTTEREARGVER